MVFHLKYFDKYDTQGHQVVLLELFDSQGRLLTDKIKGSLADKNDPDLVKKAITVPPKHHIVSTRLAYKN
jgi:hypothetical protein